MPRNATNKKRTDRNAILSNLVIKLTRLPAYDLDLVVGLVVLLERAPKLQKAGVR